MPCDTPPPPSPLDSAVDDDIVEIEVDESVYDFIEAEELEGDEMEGMPQQDDALRTFVGHADAVFTCNFDKSGQYVATGSQDESAFVWNASDGTVKFECTGHKDSVIFANFSPDSKYVATVDMNGIVQAFCLEDGSLAWSFHAYEFTWASWLHKSNVLIAGSIDGTCWKWSIPDGATEVYENAGIGTSIGAASRDDQKLAVGYSDGSIKFWDLNTHASLGSLSGPSAFKAPVTAIEYSPDNGLMISSSEDGTVKLIKMSDFKVLWSFAACDVNDHNHVDVAVESIGFCSTPSLIVVGTTCGYFGIYDISSKIKRFSSSVNSCIVKIVCDKELPVVYAALTEGVLQAYDIRTGQVIKTWSGHKAALLDLSISSDRSLLLTSSDDHTCKIFERGVL